jgi:chromosome segregation ATPase
MNISPVSVRASNEVLTKVKVIESKVILSPHTPPPKPSELTSLSLQRPSLHSHSKSKSADNNPKIESNVETIKICSNEQCIDKMSQMQSVLTTYEELIATLRADADDRQSQFAFVQSDYEAITCNLSSELSGLQSKLGELNERLMDSQNQVGELRTELLEAKNNHDAELHEVHTHHKEALLTLETNLEKCRCDIAAVETKLTVREEENMALRQLHDASIDNHRTELDTLQSKLASEVERAQTSESVVLKQEAEIAQLRHGKEEILEWIRSTMKNVGKSSSSQEGDNISKHSLGEVMLRAYPDDVSEITSMFPSE